MYIIKTDLTSASYQIPLSKDSVKYCDVATPFKGVRIYTRTAIGMLGSETALEEQVSMMMCKQQIASQFQRRNAFEIS